MRNRKASKLRAAILASASRMTHLIAIHEEDTQRISDHCPRIYSPTADRKSLSNGVTDFEETKICRAKELIPSSSSRAEDSSMETSLTEQSPDPSLEAGFGTAKSINEIRELDLINDQEMCGANPARKPASRKTEFDNSRSEGTDIRRYMQKPASSIHQSSEKTANNSVSGSTTSGKASDSKINTFFTTSKYSKSSDAPNFESTDTGSSDSSFSDADSLFDDFITTDSTSSLGPLDSISNIVNSPSPLQSQSVPPQCPIQPFIRPHSRPDAMLQAYESPMPAIKSSNRIQTCFRIAEVRRLLGSSASGEYLTLELYAHVRDSFRDAGIQTFQFADLFFPFRPPYIFGSYTKWKECDLFDEDSKLFLTTEKDLGATKEQGKVTTGSRSYGKLCRAILRARCQSLKHRSVTVHRIGSLEQLACNPVQRSDISAIRPVHEKHANDVEVLAVWETDWEDVQYVREIVDPRSSTGDDCRRY